MTTRPNPPRALATDRPAARSAARTFGDLARGVLAIVALASAVVGVPWALAVVGGSPLPSHLPTVAEVTDTLTRPDDGTLFLKALLILGWVGWAAFALSVALEIPAQLRGRTPLRLPALGGSQRAAGALVATAAVLLLSSPPARVPASTRPAIAVSRLAPTAADRPAPPDFSRWARTARSAPPGDTRADRSPERTVTDASSPQPDATRATRPAPPTSPDYTVRRHDTLWSIAEQTLGSGERFPEIARLNYGRPQPDGRALTDSHWIYPGWNLRLPPDARPPDARPPDSRNDSADAAPVRAQYVVQPGDSLWSIAEHELGNGSRYRDIAHLNKKQHGQADSAVNAENADKPGRADEVDGAGEADRAVIRDPDHIEPGWRLRIPRPAPATPHPPTATEPPTETPAGAPPPQATTTPNGHRTPAPPPTTTSARPSHASTQSASTAGPDDPPRQATPRPAEAAPPRQEEIRAREGEQDGADEPAPAPVALGLAGLTVAALLAELARRRARQQRARRTFERIVLPDTTARDTETRLRVAHDRDRLDLLRDALLSLARRCAHAGRDLPALAAVRIDRTGLRLLLTEPDLDPVEPFTVTDSAQWHATCATLRPLGVTTADDEGNFDAATDIDGDPDDEGPDAEDPDARDREREDQDVPFPYPALLTVHVDDDSTMLIDLEAAGVLTVAGDQAATRPVLDAWALELAAAPVSDTLGLTLVGNSWPASALDAARVRIPDSAEQASRDAAARAREVTAALRASHVTTLRGARSQRIVPDVWAPEVVLVADHEPSDLAENITADQARRSGPALILPLSAGDPALAGWRMTEQHDGQWRLEPLGLTVRPPRLERDRAREVGRILTAANALTSVPADPPSDAAETLRRSTDHVAQVPDQPVGAQPEPAERNPASVDRDQLTTHPAVAGDRPPTSHEDDAVADAPPDTTAPEILVLGSVELHASTGQEAGRERRSKLTEIAAYIALHPGGDSRRLDEAIWPARRISRSTRNSAVSRLRRWLGTRPVGGHWLPAVPDRGQYRFEPGIYCDWNEFQQLAQQGFAAGPDGLADLAAALELVRGRPFIGVDPDWYGWAEYDTQTMISAITDVAHILADSLLDNRDPAGALDAARKGLLVEPTSDVLTHDAVRAATALGHPADANRFRQKLETRLAEIDPDQ